MFKNYLTIAIRNLLKNKVFTTVNILGLAIGMAACFFVFLYVNFESSYDRFNKHAADLYRVTISFLGSNANDPPLAGNHPAVGPAMKSDFPEVVDYARAVGTSILRGRYAISYTNDKGQITSFNAEKLLFADQSFLNLFSFPLVEGNPKNVLAEKNTLVLSEKTAAKFFGKANPLGKIVYLNERFPFKVTGVCKEVPENSHIKFNMLASFATLDAWFAAFDEKYFTNNWKWPEFNTYVLLAPGTDPKKVEAKFPAFINKYMSQIMKQYNFGCQFHLQKITDIHLRSHYRTELEPPGSERDVYFLSIIGVLILLVAWINYINLSTAKSIERAKEVGLRKVAGASKSQLIVQFISESFVVNLLAVIIAAGIVYYCFPFFSDFIDKNISEEFLSSGMLQQPTFWLIILLLFSAGAFLVGAYPAFVLIRYQPAVVLKCKFIQSLKGILLRKSLVALQFILSILLIAGSMLVYKQLAYMRNQQLGYDKDQIVIVKAITYTDSTFGLKVITFKNELLKNSFVNDVTGSSDIPGRLIVEGNSVRRASDPQTHSLFTYIMRADENFVPTFQMQVVAGRNLLQTDTGNFFNPTTTAGVMVNEEVVKILGFKTNEAAIRQPVIFGYGPGETKAEIIGVVKNYHQRSLRESYDPILYITPVVNDWSNYLSIHINSNNLAKNIATIEATYKSLFPASPFEYFFLDEEFNNQYQADQLFERVFTLFTALAIFVACLGLLGLSSFVSRLRIKEIGIRKVLGASVYSILVLFSKDFIKLVLLASVIAMPVFYIAATMWLRNYAFHITIDWALFVLPPVLLLLIALLTISIESTRAALANPVDSIHSE